MNNFNAHSFWIGVLFGTFSTFSIFVYWDFVGFVIDRFKEKPNHGKEPQG